VELSTTSDVVVVGDLHGQFNDLQRIFERLGRPGSDDKVWVFLGDYIDRGPMGLEIVATLFALKLRHPGSIYLLRGNHECSEITVGGCVGRWEEGVGRLGEGVATMLHSWRRSFSFGERQQLAKRQAACAATSACLRCIRLAVTWPGCAGGAPAPPRPLQVLFGFCGECQRRSTLAVWESVMQVRMG